MTQVSTRIGGSVTRAVGIRLHGLLLLLFFSMCVYGCATPHDGSSEESLLDSYSAVLALADEYSQAWISHDTERIRACLTTNRAHPVTDVTQDNGADGLQQQINSDLIDVEVLDVKFEVVELNIVNDTAWTQGTLEALIRETGVDKSELRTGRFRWDLAQQHDGSWRIAYDSTHFD